MNESEILREALLAYARGTTGADRHTAKRLAVVTDHMAAAATLAYAGWQARDIATATPPAAAPAVPAFAEFTGQVALYGPQRTQTTAARALLARVYAAAGKPWELAALYTEVIGHNPWHDDPTTEPGRVLVNLEGFVREWATSMGISWEHVEPRVFSVNSGLWVTPAAMLADADNCAEPALMAWVVTAKAGDTYSQGAVYVRCMAAADIDGGHDDDVPF